MKHKAYEVVITFHDKFPFGMGSREKNAIRKGKKAYSVKLKDLDNRIKPIIDSIKTHWANDRQVSRLVVEKLYGEQDNMEIQINELS